MQDYKGTLVTLPSKSQVRFVFLPNWCGNEGIDGVTGFIPSVRVPVDLFQ